MLEGGEGGRPAQGTGHRAMRAPMAAHHTRWRCRPVGSVDDRRSGEWVCPSGQGTGPGYEPQPCQHQSSSQLPPRGGRLLASVRNSPPPVEVGRRPPGGEALGGGGG